MLGGLGFKLREVSEKKGSREPRLEELHLDCGGT